MVTTEETGTEQRNVFHYLAVSGKRLAKEQSVVTHIKQSKRLMLC